MIYFSPKDINNGADYADKASEKAALVALPQVIKRGIEIGRHGNHKAREKETITFAAPVELNGIRGNMAVVINRRGNHYYAHRIVLPDGKTFVFVKNKNNATQEPSRGVTVSSSLAETTSVASNNSISNPDENVKGNSKISYSFTDDGTQGEVEDFLNEQDANAAEDEFLLKMLHYLNVKDGG